MLSMSTQKHQQHNVIHQVMILYVTIAKLLLQEMIFYAICDSKSFCFDVTRRASAITAEPDVKEAT